MRKADGDDGAFRKLRAAGKRIRELDQGIWLVGHGVTPIG
jgi:hypothetical protein